MPFHPPFDRNASFSAFHLRVPLLWPPFEAPAQTERDHINVRARGQVGRRLLSKFMQIHGHGEERWKFREQLSNARHSWKQTFDAAFKLAVSIDGTTRTAPPRSCSSSSTNVECIDSNGLTTRVFFVRGRGMPPRERMINCPAMINVSADNVSSVACMLFYGTVQPHW